jgi:hypothetical protein
MIGKSFVLWKEEFSLTAYTDQLGIAHHGYVVMEEFEVTITEERDVKGMWGAEIFKGWKGIDKNGKIFTCNWYSFPDDSMTPTYYWDVINDGSGPWVPVDAIQASAHCAYVDKNGNKKIPIGSSICENHKTIYMDKCWKCEVNIK